MSLMPIVFQCMSSNTFLVFEPVCSSYVMRSQVLEADIIPTTLARHGQKYTIVQNYIIVQNINIPGFWFENVSSQFV